VAKAVHRLGAREARKGAVDIGAFARTEGCHAAPSRAGQVEHGRKYGAVYADGAAGESHGPRTAAIEDMTKVGKIEFEQPGECEIEKIELALLQHAEQKAGPQLSGGGKLVDKPACTAIVTVLGLVEPCGAGQIQCDRIQEIAPITRRRTGISPAVDVRAAIVNIVLTS